MKASFERLIREDTSPLFRIMSGYDITSLNLRRFENSICAFHIGNGYFLSVAHALILFNNIPRSINITVYNSIIASAAPPLQQIIQQNYAVDQTLQKYRWNENTQTAQQLLQVFPQISYDTRYPNLYNNGICTPYLLMQFKTNAFLGNAGLNNRFTNGRYFYEQGIDRHTFLIDLKIHKIAVSSDIAIYKIDDQFSDLIPIIPKIEVEFNLREIGDSNYYCLQGAPINELGRMLHKSQI